MKKYLCLKSVARNSSEEVRIELLVAKDHSSREVADLRHVKNTAQTSDLQRNLQI